MQKRLWGRFAARSGTPSRRPACGSAPSIPPPAPSAAPRPRTTFPFCPSHPSLSPILLPTRMITGPEFEEEDFGLNSRWEAAISRLVPNKSSIRDGKQPWGKPAYTSGRTVESSSGPATTPV
ncbi:hypothetical protein RHGRI_023500 [Rhododendron griersonianum]|uniref:Uncharacterized protein n=1 Tax=Rhododendron griersonianum TaxID=479676 RepID=A0AAV6J3V5_9ERIC|nr:hypothetical protein RHGRI_023500 [Rhododendron griersonianum]